MDKKEALSCLNVNPCGDTGLVLVKAEAARLGYEALGREMAREESEKPKRPTLEEQERRIRDWMMACPRDQEHPGPYDRMAAAADTLRTVREEVVPWLMEQLGYGTHANLRATAILAKLGLSP